MDIDKTLAEFEILRQNALKSQERVLLYFNNKEVNSYNSLYTSNLVKPNEAMSDKEFEDVLLTAFKAINKDVIQVNVFPVALNKTYVGRVYLKSEDEGKDFIVNYNFHRDKIHNYFKGKEVKFNININNKLFKRVREAIRKGV